MHWGVDVGIEWMGAVIGGRKWARSSSLNRPTSPSSFSSERTNWRNCAAPAAKRRRNANRCRHQLSKVINNTSQLTTRAPIDCVTLDQVKPKKHMSLNWIYITNISRHDCRAEQRRTAKGKRYERQTSAMHKHPLSHHKGLMMLRNESIAHSKVGWSFPKLVLTFNFSTSQLFKIQSMFLLVLI